MWQVLYGIRIKGEPRHPPPHTHTHRGDLHFYLRKGLCEERDKRRGSELRGRGEGKKKQQHWRGCVMSVVTAWLHNLPKQIDF